ncbi:80 kDa MCM3-associated protein [Papilio machaon]|uniref:80 kDa MCM3-associated protein n=1 Tax=Papilio machaon TaxID=76193 RepID=A0A194QRP4_PAPMA|nr:80 kDa MCM3-associated protein [Papilio machaon]
MAYFDFFRNNIENKRWDTDCIRGSCYEMCPQAEKKLREKEKLVHVLEVVGSTRQLVKSYSRSAADSNIAIPGHLRPFPVLKETIHYLLLRVTKRTDVTVSCIYDFINDRLRAIRQDMTVQRLAPDECMQLLEPMIRFYVYFGFRQVHKILCTSPLSEFDPVLNRKYLLECMKWFLSCCNDMMTRDNELTELISNWTINNADHRLICDRVLVESLYLLCNLGDMHPLYRYLSLRPDMKRAPLLRLAYKMAIANLHGNFVKLCRLSEKLCPLTYCAFYLHLPTIQRRGVSVLCQAYSSRQGRVPASAIARWLALRSDECAASLCRHYGLTTHPDHSVQFMKADFKTDVHPTELRATASIRGVSVLCQAYSSRQGRVPASAIARWLALRSDACAASICQHYGLTTHPDDSVQFMKADFKTDVHPMKQDVYVPDKIKIPIQDILTYRSDDGMIY